jgi:hypothetical protein
MGKNIPETKLDQWALRCCGGIGTTLNLVMTASLLPIIAGGNARALRALIEASVQRRAKSKPARGRDRQRTDPASRRECDGRTENGGRRSKPRRETRGSSPVTRPW